MTNSLNLEWKANNGTSGMPTVSKLTHMGENRKDRGLQVKTLQLFLLSFYLNQSSGWSVDTNAQ